MSTTVSCFGGLPLGFAIFGFFFVSAPTASAIFFTSAVGFANVGGLAVVSVVLVAVPADVPVLPELLGMSAVFVPPPHAAKPTQAAASAGHVRVLLSRITAGRLLTLVNSDRSSPYDRADEMTTRTATPSRSKEHHVAVGLGFWSSFKNGDLGACVELLHPDVEWHPSPRLDDLDVVRGREAVRNTLQTLHERFTEDLQVLPEDGRQVGDHVLMVTVLRGRGEFTKQPITSREAWVVSIRDDKLARIVVYPNAPAARLGFEELLKATMHARNPPEIPAPRVTLAPEMENSAATPAEATNVNSMPAADGVAMGSPLGSTSQVTLTFTFEEAEALNRWMLKPSRDGELPADDLEVRPGLMKIRTAVEHAQAIAAVRHELEQAGIPTQHLSDQQVAQLGRRISQAAPLLGGAQG
jgi:ketosteroid isomerase-like protein